MDEERSASRRELLERLLRAGAASGTAAGFAPSAAAADAIARSLAPIADIEAREVTWVGVNRSRVDVTIDTRDGGRWRVVFGTSDGTTIDWLDVDEQRPYTSIPGGLVVVVNGPSGAGKSSLMEAVARLSPVPWVRFHEPMFGTVDQGHLIWRETAETLHRGYVAGIAALAGAGNRVMTSAAGLPQPWFEEALSGIPAVYVGLDAPPDVLLAREDGREGRWGGLAESSIVAHEGWRYDLFLDSTAHEPVELATLVLRALARNRK